MMRSFLTLYSLDTGVDADGLLTLELYLPLTKYPEPAGQMAVHDAFLDRLATTPGLEASALTTGLPLDGGPTPGVEVDGRPAEEGETRPTATQLAVSERYFDVLGIPLLQGRPFGREDGVPGAEVAIVNQRFAEIHLGGGEVIGRRIRLVPGAQAAPDAPWLTVVGLTTNVRQDAVQDLETDPVVYVPLRASSSRAPYLAIRTQRDQGEATALLRDAMAAVEPDVPLYDILPMEERLALDRWPFRIFGTLFTLFAAIALTLSAVGLYSITANSVVQRVREFGIRASLGAEPRSISWLAARRVLGHLAIGLPLGALGAYGVGRLLQSLLVQMSPHDPVTLGAVVAVMAGVALLACLVPARRASRIDPVVALRTE